MAVDESHSHNRLDHAEFILRCATLFSVEFVWPGKLSNQVDY